MKKDIELHLYQMYYDIDIDRPSNHNDILNKVTSDLKPLSENKHILYDDVVNSYKKILNN